MNMEESHANEGVNNEAWIAVTDEVRLGKKEKLQQGDIRRIRSSKPRVCRIIRC
jgi:hypothetical protein